MSRTNTAASSDPSPPEGRERRRKVITGVLVAVGVSAVIAAALYPVLFNDSNKYRSLALDQIGASALDAGCKPQIIRPASGGNDHRHHSETIDYDQSPPAYGPHWPIPQDMAQKFYTAKDRPPVEMLVHNLEHGFTILWYDESLNSSDIEQLKAIGSKYPNTTGVDDKFIVAPWTDEDGAPFPAGTHLVLTHWSVSEDLEDEGVWQYCAKVSGEVVERFVSEFPFTDAPEGNLPGNM